MIPGMPAEVTCARRLGDKKPQQIEIKVPARFKIRGVETEVAEAANLKGSIQRNPADVVFFRRDHVHSPVALGRQTKRTAFKMPIA
jgi:hypothetical protein